MPQIPYLPCLEKKLLATISVLSDRRHLSDSSEPDRVTFFSCLCHSLRHENSPSMSLDIHAYQYVHLLL